MRQYLQYSGAVGRRTHGAEGNRHCGAVHWANYDDKSAEGDHGLPLSCAPPLIGARHVGRQWGENVDLQQRLGDYDLRFGGDDVLQALVCASPLEYCGHVNILSVTTVEAFASINCDEIWLLFAVMLTTVRRVDITCLANVDQRLYARASTTVTRSACIGSMHQKVIRML